MNSHQCSPPGRSRAHRAVPVRWHLRDSTSTAQLRNSTSKALLRAALVALGGPRRWHGGTALVARGGPRWWHTGGRVGGMGLERTPAHRRSDAGHTRLNLHGMSAPSSGPRSSGVAGVARCVNGGVDPRINGEQRVSEATRCRAGHQEVASRQAASRLLRCAPALRVTCRNLLIRLAFMAGSELPAITGPFARTCRFRMSTPISCVRQIPAVLRSHQHTLLLTSPESCESRLIDG